MEVISQQIPMLSVPLKVTEDADFTQAFKKYIMEHYQEDPENYANEISILNRLRQDIRGVGKDMTGRDILYRYYEQLELLDLRFPLDEKHVKVSFTWYDAFSEEGVSQYSGAYEKACVIFNLGAILSAIAATQNRFEEEGRKIAYNYFQASAGLFQFINDNFLHAPSVDIQRESVKCLNKLMLASAQECFLEKTISEKKKANLLSKIASYLAFTYSEIADDMDVVDLREQFDDSWTSLVKVKSKYYSTISHYYKALACADEGKYGHIISYLTLAENYAKEANKLAKSFSYNYPSFSVSSSDIQSATSGKSTSASQSLFEATKTYLALVTEKKKQAIKDNDIVYQEAVPNADTLEAPEKLCVVKNLNFVDICPGGQKEAQSIIGQDIFHRLIPISVHEASSLYSEEKAKILRAEMDRCDNADADFQLLMETQDIANTINKAKDALKNEGINKNMVSFPEEIATYCNLVQQESQAGKSITSTIASLNTLQMKARENLNSIGLELDKEQREYDLKMQMYSTKWTQESPITASANIRQNLKKYRTSLDEAITADNVVISKYNANKNSIDSLQQPVDKVKEDYINSIISEHNKKEPTVNLIDVNMDDVESKKQDEKEMIDKIETLVMNLKGCQGERKKLIDELKYRIQNDDISNILLIKKHKEKQVFQNELAKFQVFRDNISRNINDHNNFLNTLTEEFNKLKSDSDTFKSVNTINEKKEQKNKEFKEAFELWKDIYKNLDSGIRCYTNLNEMINSLKMETNKYMSQRLSQRNDLEKKIKEEKAAIDQKVLLNKLNSLNLGSTATTTTPTTSYTPNAPPSNIQTPATSYTPGAPPSNIQTPATSYTPGAPPSNIQTPTTNYYASQPTVTSPQTYSFANTTNPATTTTASSMQSPTIMQRSSVVLSNTPAQPLSLVTSPTQPSTTQPNSSYTAQQPQQPQQSITTPLYQQSQSAAISQQTPYTQYNYQQSQQTQPPAQTQPTSYTAYQQTQPQLSVQNQTALKLQQALTSAQSQPPQPQPQIQPTLPTQSTYQTQPSTYTLPTSSSTSQTVNYPTMTSPVTQAPSYPTITPTSATFQRQPSLSQSSTTPAYLQTSYTSQTQLQTQPVTNTYPTTTTNYSAYQTQTQAQNAYSMYKPVTATASVPAIPPKPTATQDPLSSSLMSPVRPPLPPPPGSLSFSQTSSTGNLFAGQPSQPQSQTQPLTQTQQPQATAYMNYYGQPTVTSAATTATAATTNAYMNQYTTAQPQRPAVPQTSTQPSYYNPQPQPQQQPIYATNPNVTTTYAYPQQQQQQQPLAQNPYYRPPTQQQPQPQLQQQTAYYPQAAAPTAGYYQQQPQQPQQPPQQSIAQIQSQQLASLSQYKPLQPQKYNQPSLLD